METFDRSAELERAVSEQIETWLERKARGRVFRGMLRDGTRYRVSITSAVVEVHMLEFDTQEERWR